MKFTEIGITALKPPAKGAVIFYDKDLPGFGVRVSQAGTKSYILTHGSRRYRETIGRVGIVTLKAARMEAKRRLAEYTLGKHHPRAVGWDTALEEYLEEVKGKRRQSTYGEYKRVLEKHFPFEDARIFTISTHDLQRDLDKLRGSERFHAYTYLRAFINWAYSRHYLESNPMERMAVPEGSIPRQRILAEEEIKTIWNAAGNDAYGRIVKLLLLTGQRRGEITGLTRNMIGPSTVTFPITKNGRVHTIPLGKFAAAQLPKTTGLLFPARGKPTQPFNGWSKPKQQLDDDSGVTGWTLHDLRRTFASGLASQGVSLHVIEKLLNHVSGSFGGIVGVYQRYDFFPEMKQAIETWEARVQTIVA